MQDYDPYDVEGADLMCVGCAAHEDPACLCDVDLSRGTCGPADKSLMHGGADMYPLAYMEERLKRAERRWMLDTFAPGLLDHFEYLYSGRAAVEHYDVGATVEHRGETFIDYVREAYAEAENTRVAVRVSEVTGISRGRVENHQSIVYGLNGTLWQLLKAYTLYLWHRAPEGTSRAAVGREVEKMAPGLKPYTVYRWIWDDANLDAPRTSKVAA